MSDQNILTSRAPYHIILYGLSTGTQFFQSFVAGIVAYKALTKPQFSQLQQKIFPIYFFLQTGLPALLLFTYPGLASRVSGFQGAMSDTWGTLFPLSTAFVTSSLNLLLVGPATTNTMRERKVQETRDNKKYDDPGPQSKEMLELNYKFGTLHGISSLLNLAGFIGTLWYGVSLAKRIR